MTARPDCQCLECQIVRETAAATAAADKREAELDAHGYGRPTGHVPGPVVVGLTEFIPESAPVKPMNLACPYCGLDERSRRPPVCADRSVLSDEIAPDLSLTDHPLLKAVRR